MVQRNYQLQHKSEMKQETRNLDDEFKFSVSKQKDDDKASNC